LANTKIVSSFFGTPFSETLSSDLIQKLSFDGIDTELTKDLQTPDFLALSKNAIANSDGLVVADSKIDKNIKKEILSSSKPTLHFFDQDGFEDAYRDFYTNQILK
jgi:starch synthase